MCYLLLFMNKIRFLTLGCSYLAKDPWKIKEHCRTHTGERKIACPSCGMFFANKTKLADHLIRQDTKQCMEEPVPFLI